jgi:hypothetical protein
VKPHHWHYSITIVLSIALVPAFRWLHLPLKFDWITLSSAYWIVLAAQSIFVAAALCLIGLPRQALEPLLSRYLGNPVRIVLLLLYFAVLAWAFTARTALVLTFATAAILEFRERHNRQELLQSAKAVLLPSLYFFVGFLLVLAYNSVIVSLRFNFTWDPAFWAADKWLLHGYSVSDLSHWAVHTFNISFFRFLEFVYFGMFPQIGATIVIVALCDGKTRGLQFVGTILMAYYLALAVFYIWPSQGPYYLCPSHFSRFPNTLQVYAIQKTLIAHAMALWNHVPIRRISTDYFIGLPCMHLAQPLIAMWFLRRWKRMVIALAVYDLLLVVSILLLEMHYVVDIIAGVLIAVFAIAISKGAYWHRKRTGPASAQEGALSPA